jgi:predicted anti-sigma-YlaC factor YlaD
MSQVRVFQCPSCKEFIATDAKTCRFCSTPISEEVALAQAQAQAEENRIYRRKKYARHMLSGGGLAALGLAITIGTLVAATVSEAGGHYVITYGLILVGGGDFLYGLVGWLGELRKT